jgi:hypothetical protein
MLARLVAARTTAFRVLVGGFCAYHMGASALANMPGSTAFGNDLRAPFDAYITYSGLWQSWTMFETIPYFESIRPVLVAHYRDGRDVDLDPMLPGLRPYRHRTRLAGLFLRFVWPDGGVDWFVRGYLQRACVEAVRAAPPDTDHPATMGLRLDSERLLPLPEVRRRGSIGWPAHDHSPVTVPCD